MLKCLFRQQRKQSMGTSAWHEGGRWECLILKHLHYNKWDECPPLRCKRVTGWLISVDWIGRADRVL